MLSEYKGKFRYDSILSYIVSKSSDIMGMGTGKLTIEKMIAGTLKVCIENDSLLDNYALIFQSLTDQIGISKQNMMMAMNELCKYIRESGESEEALNYTTMKMAEVFMAEEKSNSEYIHAKTIIDKVFSDPSPAIKAAIIAARRDKKIPAKSAPAYKSTKTAPPKKRKENVLYSIYESMDTSSLILKFEGSKKGMTALTFASKKLHSELKRKIIGQENAVNTFVSGFFQAFSKRIIGTQRKQPAATFLFAGPPGVGKTYLAETAAEILGLPYKRFDMSEFADRESSLSFNGSNKVYKNGNPGVVTQFVSDHPKCVLLFDEIEKAHAVAIRLFLQILDAGRLRDAFMEKEVSFSDAIIIMTTNAGRELYEGSDMEDFSNVSRKVVLEALKADMDPVTGNPYFPPEICSRFLTGNVVMFNYMSAAALKTIAENGIKSQIAAYKAGFGLNITVDDNLYSTLIFAEGGNADARTISNRTATFLSDEIFELTRIITSRRLRKDLNDLEEIDIQVDIPLDTEEIRSLYVSEYKPAILVFSDDKTFNNLNQMTSLYDFYHASTVQQAQWILSKCRITMIIADPGYGINWNIPQEDFFLNIEDVDSLTRDFLWCMIEHYRDIPVYIMECNCMTYSSEEKVSFLKMGVRDVIDGNASLSEISENIYNICRDIHRQDSIKMLARSNKVLSFETAQIMPSDNRAVIKLFDLELTTAVDAKDSKNVLSNASKPETRFYDVIGAEDAKKELSFFVNYLKNPRQFVEAGLSAPKGVLLYGPPGTGKTMLAKAMAGESDVTFMAVEGNRFLQKHWGEGAEMIHELFRTARKYAPTIVFIDEIDSVGIQRTGSENSQYRGDLLTALLTEMDGFNTNPSKPVFVLAATNFDIDGNSEKKLDPALIRRFDSRIYVDLPNRDERRRYLEQEMKKNPAFHVSEDMLHNIAVRSVGMSLAQLEGVMELSLRIAVRAGKLKITDEILDEAFEYTNSGEEHHWNEKDLERVARHEAGHTVISWLSGDKPSYVTITSRSGHGGYMQHGDNEGKLLYTKDELIARIRTALGGRAAEIVYYGEKEGLSSGASNDLYQATKTAEKMICEYGMSEKRGLAYIETDSSLANEELRSEINDILAREMEFAVRTITENKAAIDALVSELMVKNHLTEKEIDILLKDLARV